MKKGNITFAGAENQRTNLFATAHMKPRTLTAQRLPAAGLTPRNPKYWKGPALMLPTPIICA